MIQQSRQRHKKLDRLLASVPKIIEVIILNLYPRELLLIST